MDIEHDTIWCDGCGVEIFWSAVVKGKSHYCCTDCADGLPCPCGERMELDERRRADTSENEKPEVKYAIR